MSQSACRFLDILSIGIALTAVEEESCQVEA